MLSTNLGSYMGIKFTPETQIKIKNWCDKFNISNPVLGEDLHTTIMYSTKYINVENKKYTLYIDPKTYSLEIFGKNILVLRYETSTLSNRWKELIDMGATYDFDEFKIHMTLSYEFRGGKRKLRKLKIPTFPLILEREYVEDLDLEYNI